MTPVSNIIKRPFCETGRILLRMNVLFWKNRQGMDEPTSVTYEHEHWHLKSKEDGNV